MSAHKRILLILMAIFIVAMGSFGAYIYYTTSEAVRWQLGSKCVGIASAVAVLIEQDLDGYREFIRTLDTDSEYYRNMRENFQRIRDYNGDSIAFLYSEIRISDTEMMYILDAEDEDSDMFSPPGSVDEMTDSEIYAYDTRQPYIALNNEDDIYGSHLTSYAPVYDRSTGEFVGLVGTDVSMDQYRTFMRGQLQMEIGSISVLLVTVLLTILFSSNKVEKMITVDGLTGVYNKTYFMRHLKEQIKFTEKKKPNATVLMADLDHFKMINDKYGHPFGDEVLLSVAKSIASSLRKSDCLARYGGEEFVALLPDSTEAASAKILERVRASISELSIYSESFDEYVNVTISIGSTQVEKGQTAADVIEIADKALYMAKRTRNAVVHLSAEDSKAVAKEAKEAKESAGTNHL